MQWVFLRMYRVTLTYLTWGKRKIIDSKVTFCNGYVSSQECNFLSIQHVFAQILQHHCNMHRISLDQSVCFFQPGAPSAMPKTTAWVTITSLGCSFSICSFQFPHTEVRWGCNACTLCSWNDKFQWLLCVLTPQDIMVSMGVSWNHTSNALFPGQKP